jgi:ornithine cyclodeaminase/alanine dehydrogenase-like protein (mu-crystallin family)
MKGDFIICTDDDIAELVSGDDMIGDIVAEVEEFFRDKKKGQVVSPPRFTCEASEGKLVVTAGASERKRLIGLRAYSTFGFKDNDPQITVVYDMEGSLRGIFIGETIGRVRTAAINAVAVKHMSRHDSRILGVIGSGKQARSVVPYIARMRQLEKIIVFSLHPEHAKTYIQGIRDEMNDLGIELGVGETAEETVSQSDIILTVTTSSSPVIRNGWTRSGQHISCMGRKFREAHEIEPETVLTSDIVASDSAQQLKDYGSLFFIDESGRERISDLSDLVDGSGRKDEDKSLFLSVGLAGTEVAVAGRILSKIEKEAEGTKKFSHI